MPSYLVEAYVAHSNAHEARAAGDRARAAAAELSREGTSVRYVRTTFLPDDETCFHLIEAPSAEVAADVVHRARLGRARIRAALE